jgi:ATP-dependent exoDNAse (exonuclease V) alpha subunit
MARRMTVAEEAIRIRAEGADAVVLTKTRNEATAVNELCRALRRRSGELSGDSMNVDGRDFQVGDLAICTRPDNRLGVVNGLRGEVVAVDPSGQSLKLRTGANDFLIDTRRYEHIDHAYALTAHKAQGMTCDVALVAGSEVASKEWVYSVMSRARKETRYFFVETPVNRDLDGVRHDVKLEHNQQRSLAQSWSRSDAKDSSLDYQRLVRP